jgi:Tfp pilus assembly protein PilN
MPLHVNLYHEVQAQERARQRDPLRLGMLGLLVIAIGFVVYYVIALGSAHTVASQYAALQSEYSRLDPKAQAAKAREAELNDSISASDTMMKEVDGRFYWAPVLDQILQTVPLNVQLTQVGASLGSPASGTNVLTITGISSASEPRKAAEQLRTALAARLGKQFKNVNAFFKTLDDSDEVVVLNGARLPTATFTIEFDLKVNDPALDTPPPTRHAKI